MTPPLGLPGGEKIVTNDQHQTPTEAAEHASGHGPTPKFLYVVYAVIISLFLIYLVRFVLLQNTHPLYNF